MNDKSSQPVLPQSTTSAPKTPPPVGTSIRNNTDVVSNEETKADDWLINVNNKMKYNLNAPSFIRLFMIRRIVFKYINDINNDNKSFIKQLTFKRGVDPNLIEDLVNVFNNNLEIISQKFEQEYNELMKYKTKNVNKVTYYQDLVFNINNLMPHIFQYLQWGRRFNKDLSSFSLVNSCWLYHSWNIHSVYYVDLT